MDVQIVLLVMSHKDLFIFHRYFRQSCILKRQDGSQKEGINQIAIIIKQLHIDSQIPSQFSLDDTKSLFVSGARRLYHFVDKGLDFDSHFRKGRGLLIELS
jgi:hypothetical protein